MGHLGVTEVLLALGLAGLIFAETIARRFTRWVARTSPPGSDAGPTPALAAHDSAREAADLEGDPTSEVPPSAADSEKVLASRADAGS